MENFNIQKLTEAGLVWHTTLKKKKMQKLKQKNNR